MRVCPGIMTGLQVQYVDFVEHGSELYIKIGISSLRRLRAVVICQRVNQTLVQKSAAPVRPQLWVPFGRCSFLVWPTASLLSVVEYTLGLSFLRNTPSLPEICEVVWFHTLHHLKFRLLSLG